MIISVSVVIGFKDSIRSKVIGFDAPIHVSKTQINTTFENVPFSDSSHYRETITSFPFVKSIQVFATKPTILKGNSDFEGIVLKGVDKDFDFSFFENNLVEGTIPDYADEVSNQLLISKKLANKLQLKAGDDAIMYFVQDPPATKKAIIVGIYSTDIEDIDDVFAICNIQIIRQLNQWRDNQIGGYEILTNSVDLDKLSEWNDDIRFSLSIDLNSKTIVQRYPQIFDWLGLLNVNIQIILSLMTIVAAINMITALLIMILERTQMIGLLKAIGARNLLIRKIFIYNAAFFIGIGVLAGNFVAFGLLFLQDYFGLITLSETSYYISKVPVAFPWHYFILIDITTLVICSLAMLIPSILVTRILPVKALRFN